MSQSVEKFSVEVEREKCETCFVTITAVNGEGQPLTRRLDLSGNAIPAVLHGFLLALQNANELIGNHKTMEVTEVHRGRKHRKDD